MGFASGSVTFRRYRVVGGSFDSVDDRLIEALNANAFGRYGSPDDTMELGWITPRHLFDVEFAGEKVAAGRFAHFRMRIDRNAVPGAILRSYVEIEQQAALEASGREFLSKSDRRQAKEAAAARAEQEARSGAFRRIGSYSLLWDLEKGFVYFGNSGSSANEKLQRLFTDTFEAVLEPCSAHAMAIEAAERAGHRRALEDAQPAHFITAPADVDADYYSADPEDRSFFGREFLTWLWHRVDQEEGLLPSDDGSEVAATITKLAHFKCGFNLTGSAMLRSDGPGSMAESRAAIATGKQPSRLGLLLAGRAGEWAFVLDAVGMDVSGLTLPASESKDAAVVLEERFEAVADLGATLDALFRRFMSLRLSSEWAKTHEELKRWVAGNRAGDRTTRPRLVSA